MLAQVLEPGMGMGTKLAIGLLGMTIDMGWYLIVALALTGTGAVDWLRAKGQLIYRITAVALWVICCICSPSNDVIILAPLGHQNVERLD